MTKRISLSEYDAAHLYDLALPTFQEGCADCKNLKNRLEDFIGKDVAESIKKQQEEHPYD